jgi:hypothetical protein
VEEKNKRIMGLFYLFLSEEGRLSDSQMRVFDSTGGLYSDNFAQEKDEIINKVEIELSDYCKQQYGKSIIQCNRSEIIIKFLDSYIRWYINDSSSLKRIAWRCIDAFYRYEEDSYGKRAIIKRIIEIGKIDDSIVAEMQDTSQTFKALDKYNRWISSMEKHSDNTRELKEELDKDWKDTSESITTLMVIG